MNDRFKFRTPIYGADGKFKKFVYWNAENGFPAITCRKGDVFKQSEQCTGLKDKNGRLIYEGDIITVANGSINGNVFTSNWEVVWEEENGKYRVPSWISDKPDFSHFVVVIGNIHENPELLEVKNERKTEI